MVQSASKVRTPGKTSRPSTRNRPRQARSRQRQQEILEAARRLIARGDLDAVTTQTIAQEAGVPVGSIYYLYTDKYEIYRDILNDAFDRMRPMLEPISLNGKDWQASVGEVFRSLAAFYSRDRAYAVLYRSLRYTPQLREVDLAFNRSVIDALRETFQLSMPDVAQRRTWAMAHTVVSIGDRLLQDLLDVKKKSDRQLIIEEGERALIGYLEECRLSRECD